jgi:hypothetical protein
MQLSKAGEKCFCCSTTDDLILVGSYWYCSVHKSKRNEANARNNPKNNGSEAHLKSLRDHFARKKGRPDVKLPVAQVVNDNLEYFASLLAPFQDWLLSNNVIIYDTESDGVGATHALELTREYHFYSLATGKPLNVWARKKDGQVNPTYTHKEAARQILSFIDSADFLIAYEPPSNDRNRLKSLLGDQVYAALVEPKVVDFKRTVIKSLFTTDNGNPNRIYLRGLTQPDVYENLLQVGSVSYPKPDDFLPIPDTWKSTVDMKCRADVHMLHNLFIYFQSILSQ